MADLIVNESAPVAHPQIDAMKRELYAALKAMKAKDMTPQEFDLAVLLAGEFEE